MSIHSTLMRLCIFSLIFLLPTSSLAEIKFSKQLMMDMSRTYGYHVGQNHTLNLIEQEYPSLKNEVFLAKNEFKLVFGSSIDNIDKYMNQLGKKTWDDIKKKMYKEIPKTAPKDISRDFAIRFIKEVKQQRSKGNIEEPVIQTLLMFKNGYEQHPSREFLDGFRYKYKNNGIGKSKGIKFSIEVPKTWTAKDGNRPNVVQKFVNHEGASLGVLILDIPLEPNEVIGKEEIAYLLTEEGIKTLLPPKSTLVNKGNLTLENLNGIWIQYRLKMSRVRTSVKMEVIMYMIIYQDKMIQIQGIVPISYNGVILKNGGISKYEKLFDLMANSFVINNLYQ